MRAVALTLVLLSASCTRSAAVHVVVEGTLIPNQQFDALVLEISRTDSGEVLQSDTISGDTLRLPYSFNVFAGASAPKGTEVKVLVRTLRQTVLVAQASGTGVLSDRDVPIITLTVEVSSEGGPCSADVQCAPSLFCHQASGVCTTACTSDSDCGEGKICLGMRCLGRRALGEDCSRAEDCLSTFCADGVCCNQACGGVCDVCNVTRGQCTLAPNTAAGTPSCAPSACSGTSSVCGTTCSGTLGCAPGYTCATNLCTPKVDTLTDDFQDNSTNTTRWTVVSGTGAAAAETGGRLQLTLTGGTNYAGYKSVELYDLTGSAASVEVAGVGNQALASQETRLRLNANATQALGLIIRQNTVIAFILNGNYTDIGTFPYSAGTVKYLRIREAGGTVYWEVSLNKTAWTFVATRPIAMVPLALTSFSVQIDNGCYQNEAGLTPMTPSSSAFEAFNP
ncbi:MAG: hypothetical protein ACT4TC_04175 [Myxococcaceae bacterium]